MIDGLTDLTLQQWGPFLNGAGWGLGATMTGVGVMWKLVQSSKPNGNGNGNGKNEYQVGHDLGGLERSVAQLAEVQKQTQEEVADGRRTTLQLLGALERHEGKANDILSGLSIGIGSLGGQLDRVESILSPKAVDKAVERLLGGRRRRGKSDRRNR